MENPPHRQSTRRRWGRSRAGPAGRDQPTGSRRGMTFMSTKPPDRPRQVADYRRAPAFIGCHAAARLHAAGPSRGPRRQPVRDEATTPTWPGSAPKGSTSFVPGRYPRPPRPMNEAPRAARRRRRRPAPRRPGGRHHQRRPPPRRLRGQRPGHVQCPGGRADRRPRKPAVFYSSTNKVYGNLEHVEVVRAATAGTPTTICRRASTSEERLDFHSPYGCSKEPAISTCATTRGSTV